MHKSLSNQPVDRTGEGPDAAEVVILSLTLNLQHCCNDLFDNRHVDFDTFRKVDMVECCSACLFGHNTPAAWGTCEPMSLVQKQSWNSGVE